MLLRSSSHPLLQPLFPHSTTNCKTSNDNPYKGNCDRTPVKVMEGKGGGGGGGGGGGRSKATWVGSERSEIPDAAQYNMLMQFNTIR